ncbi:hypothetical protein N7492_002800 [Penicillium capsulatum]|uniref:Peptidyl-tRNA hydrolase n=1 Tax=Penicillium capsulatum TaxID=69766 RepID=A0A9W9LW12_9EURO|nr:hypothetical protein N7492_002800 [Penicillium capsulatum]KAJ6122603.1 hypothetical protein N7512_005068 [Penicillium capsulatum]
MAQPRRLLFIASIGNQGPYRRTRHSAGHILLDALAPRLRARLAPAAPLYTTWYSPSFMNESGPKLVRQLQKWLTQHDEAQSLGTDRRPGTGAPATLVILHDELEAAPGKLRVKRGGPEQASLRGHRGLISVLESLRGKGMYPVRAPTASPGPRSRRGKESALPRDLSILRVGIGIGRPSGREKNAVADYVLTAMDEQEIEAVQRVVEPVVEILEEEICRDASSDGTHSV